MAKRQQTARRSCTRRTSPATPRPDDTPEVFRSPDELNDFGPNLRAVERARDLLEMAEGTKNDGDTDGKGLKWQGTLEELLVIYRTVTVSESVTA